MLSSLAFVLSALLITSSNGQTTLSGPTQCAAAGSYNLCQNLWGRQSGVGSQTSTLISSTGNTVSWSTNWTWANADNSVKSYANVESTQAKGMQLSRISSAPTSWHWSYTTRSNPIRADVAYDIWMGTASSGTPASSVSKYEIMIWLSGLGGIQPVGSQKSTATIAGHSWDIWEGLNTNWDVISFKITGGQELTTFDVDLQDFFKFLTGTWGVSSSQYIHSIQAGTEPFTGAANLNTSSYSVSINTT